jgi:hypothetical protein
LDNFKGVTIAVDASHYLQQLLEGSPEPLLPALGGLPLAFESHINSVLDQWKAHDMTPLFIFDGQSVVGQENTALKTAKAAVERAQAAWALYADNQASAAVSSFGSSGMILNPAFRRSNFNELKARSRRRPFIATSNESFVPEVSNSRLLPTAPVHMLVFLVK